MPRIVLLLMLIAVLLPTAASAGAPSFKPFIVRELPHDPTAFTQGLLWHEGRFIESTGHFGISTVRRMHPESGRPEAIHILDEKEFAEGIALARGVLHLLTWQSGNGYLLDPGTLNVTGRFVIPSKGPNDHEAWGLASTGTLLVMSDGTARLTVLEPLTFKPVDHLTVQEDGRPVRRMNEMEFVEGRLLANIWKQDRIAVINLESGAVEAWIDLTPLRAQVGDEAGVANGIAWDADNRRLFVTGKDWDAIFEIDVPGLLPNRR